MIIGERFAYAHVPKTGGDAAYVYFRHLTECSHGTPDMPQHKHSSFWWRFDCFGKEFMLCGIRRLPEWTWSCMNEFQTQKEWYSILGTHNPANIDYTLSRPWGDHVLLMLICGVKITHWLRQEHLFEDVVNFVQGNLHDVSEEKVRSAQELPTKVGRNQGNPFTEQQVEQLYDMNPHWAAVERQVYG